MSKLAALDHLLERYQALQYHQDPVLFQRLQDVQTWQKARLKASHQALFSAKNNQLMAAYFVDRLYGGPDFDILAQQIARLAKHAHKVESLIPENAIKTGTHGIELAILAVELDEQVAKQLLQDYSVDETLTDQMMSQTYIRLNQADLRLKQLRMADEFGGFLDTYLRSFIIQTAFKMCKSVAYKHQFQAMYDFMSDGFIALKPLKSAEEFVKKFTAQERQVIQKVHAGHPNPFHPV
ncbi:FFLEELY motif protein [Acinetobacter sp. MD2(2019)]|uniref:FFLEELY motif protein n=1 Tax=Acinetobacter sp. MD2(2019) TaxID=2605273 RepID=UPI002D1F7EF1|nr:hypothetical protein [Acinetobacter sp. MD2(2019)]MEB3753236.1 hypothetical protein [Acinetobacter sp. MD2(2019)]